ncbi:probable E3 ubiquitin-protein ligase RHC1A [Phragmites australis]|uniref:probable E3 ubiquitin-protein ligase RHC1A n=1 Tax=Phragmites australis TaxID=29695 RepID=UPI002D79EFE2|nr:probable E3 ubiquitin-protein ligase RHC1A [Phragmites australis]XP_062207155.1 probable E3 ubiquitin-protein ligase RHC1A [Phragmites australis]
MSNRATHWCYACQRPIRLRGQDIICPNCNDGFIQEISEVGGMLNTYGLFDPDFEERRGRRFRMMEAMSSLMRERMAEMGRDRVFDIHGRQGTSTQHGRQPTVGPTLIFGSNVPDHPRESSNVDVIFRGGRRAGIDRPNFSSFLLGPSLEALFEQLLIQNNRQGPAPAPQSAMDSMPVVKISRRHLNDDPQCPVCKDKFEVGSEAREMPCKHLYHTDCIIPWLVQHNSCPVCRHPLPSQQSGNSTHVPSAYYNEAADPGVTRADPEPVPRINDGGSQERHSSFSLLWPFGPSSSNSSSYQYEGNVGEREPAVYEDPSQITYSEWHYDH